MTDFRCPTFIAFDQPRSAPRHNHVNSRVANFKPPAKRREMDVPTSCPESLLLSLCRRGKWDQAIARCETHPQEAVPIELQDSGSETTQPSPWKRDRKHDDAVKFDSHLISNIIISPTYEKTALGIVCESSEIPSDAKLTLIRRLLMASPDQLSASQKAEGCTPLRGLIHSHTCDPKHLTALLEADRDLSAVSMRDMSGLRPADHLVMRLHLDPCELNVQLFCSYVDVVETRAFRSNCLSPLIRLLSTSSYQGPTSNKSFREVFRCTKHLLDKNPSRINETSETSGCTVLHVALRNFGDHQLLIQLLLDVAPRRMLASRNVFGDLPLHVASAGGSPMDILKMVLRASLESVPMPVEGPHSLVWSTNNSGYTPVDLEWMRHIEGGGGLFERRTFYPLEERGLRRCASPRQEGLYQSLLRKAVGQAMDGKPGACSFGALLDRILLIVQTANGGKESRDDNILHAACSLASTCGPPLPKPLLFLIHRIHREQTAKCDERGRLPLHYALMNHQSRSENAMYKPSGVDGKDSVWIDTLLDTYGQGARIADKEHRLPLHYALDTSCVETSVVKKLILNHPESLERRDPVSGLYPFQQAAVSNLDTCFHLLRRAPNLVLASLQNS